MRFFCFLRVFLLLIAVPAIGEIQVGIGKKSLTPPIGTPSAGYHRKGGIQGVHDPLFASALLLDNGDKKIAFCSVDHLGFTYSMVQEVRKHVLEQKGLEDYEVYIASTHTHSGGGAYLNLPVLEEFISGKYQRQIEKFYIDSTVAAILEASQNMIPAKVGIGYGKSEGISQYRAKWPIGLHPSSEITLIKITSLDDHPLAALFNFALHPTVLPSTNFLFSSDFVGYARDALQSFLGIESLYFNGAQAEIVPVIFNEEDRFDSCNQTGYSLALSVKTLWENTPTAESLQIETRKKTYTFQPKPTPFGLSLSIKTYATEMNAIILNQKHVFLTIPGELSCVYDHRLKVAAHNLGFKHLSIFGLTNDAHGYIILPAAWLFKTSESGLSFGGENYGDEVEAMALSLLQNSREWR